MSSRTKKILAGTGGLVVVGLVAFWLLGDKPPGDIIRSIAGSPPICPLTGEEPSDEELLERPAVAVKIENNSAAYPLSGLAEAELVYEELVEGGITRFMAFYHCEDTRKAGPVRSARTVDPEIMGAITRILGAAGGNKHVRAALDEGEIVAIDENTAGNAMRRIERSGITSEHTLYADTAKLRKLGQEEFEDAPPDDLFEFGDVPEGGKPARTVTMNFTVGSRTIEWRWEGDQYVRYEEGALLPLESGEPVADNVIIEIHKVDFAEGIVDVAGTPSVLIADPTGSGKAILFRDGKAFIGRWERESLEDPVSFVLKSGDTMSLAVGKTWIELLPNKKGDVQGSFSYAK